MSNIYFSIIALFISGIITLAFGIIKNNISCVGISVVIFLLTIFRLLIAKKYSNLDYVYQAVQDDMISKKLKVSDGKYAMMYNLYKSNHCELLYGENDGVMLYDAKKDLYIISADSKNACKDMLSKMKYASNELLLLDNEYAEIFQKEYRYKKEVQYYVNNQNNKYTTKDTNIDLKIEDINSLIGYDEELGIYFKKDTNQKRYIFSIKNNELIADKLYVYTTNKDIGESFNFKVFKITKFYQ